MYVCFIDGYFIHRRIPLFFAGYFILNSRNYSGIDSRKPDLLIFGLPNFFLYTLSIFKSIRSLNRILHT